MTNAIPRKSIKVLILAKHLDGGTGKFLMQLTHLYRIFPGQYQLFALALEKPQFRTPNTGSVPLLFHRDQSRQPYYYRVTPSALWRIARELRWFFAHANHFHPDIVLTIDAHCALLGSLYKLFYPKVSFVLTIHNNLRAVTFHKLTLCARAFMFFVCRKLFILSDAVVGISQGVSADVQHLFSLNKPAQTIYYGLNNKGKRGFVKPARTNPNHFPTLISVGRLAPQKDFENLIRAARLVKNVFPRMRLFILGGGDQLPTLKRLVVSLHLVDCVYFVGWQPETSTYYKQSDIFVLSSHFEGFSYALLEGMRRGFPVISTDTPYGPSEILANGRFGLLVAPSDPEAMAKAIISLSSNKSLYKRLSKAAYRRSGCFSEEKMLKQYHALFVSLLTKKRKPQPFPLSSRAEPVG